MQMSFVSHKLTRGFKRKNDRPHTHTHTRARVFIVSRQAAEPSLVHTHQCLNIWIQKKAHERFSSSTQPALANENLSMLDSFAKVKWQFSIDTAFWSLRLTSDCITWYDEHHGTRNGKEKMQQRFCCRVKGRCFTFRCSLLAESSMRKLDWVHIILWACQGDNI